MQATNNKVEEKYLRPIARELAIGLNAVHKASVIHRDIKGTFLCLEMAFLSCESAEMKTEILHLAQLQM